MSADLSKVSISKLEALVVEAGEVLLAADEEGGIGPEEARWDELIHGATRELLRRGSEGETVVSRFLEHSNPEVVLTAASVALAAKFDILQARSALQKMCASRAGSGWPAHYAQKVLARYP